MPSVVGAGCREASAHKCAKGHASSSSVEVHCRAFESRKRRFIGAGNRLRHRLDGHCYALNGNKVAVRRRRFLCSSNLGLQSSRTILGLHDGHRTRRLTLRFICLYSINNACLYFAISSSPRSAESTRAEKREKVIRSQELTLVSVRSLTKTQNRYSEWKSDRDSPPKIES